MGIATLTKSAELLSPEVHVLTQEELRSLQLLLVEMMNDIAYVCQQQHIPWSLAGGSALGAVRHNGFIPWDDDIDISMFREDFEKFKKIFPGKNSDKYQLKLPGDTGYLYQFPKIYRKNTVAQTIQSSPDEKACVSIDIFILENTSDNKCIRIMHGIVCNAFLLVDSAMRMKRCKSNLLKYGANSLELCEAVKKRAMISFPFSFLRLEQWLAVTEWAFKLCKNVKSEYIVIPGGNGHFFGEIYLRRKMEELAQVDFEGNKYFVPSDTDYLLRTRYGDNYMEIPEQKDREQHAFIRFDLDCTMN